MSHQRTEPIFMRLSYPSHPLVRRLFKSPIMLWRLGLGFLVGRLFMVMTTTGRKSGSPRHTAIEFHQHKGRKYVFSAWGNEADWYKNILADPSVTIQTTEGTEHVVARRVTRDDELTEAFELVERNPTMRRWVRLLGVQLTEDDFIAHKDSYHLLTFDPANEPTPPPLRVDLWWVWLLVLAALLAGWYGSPQH